MDNKNPASVEESAAKTTRESMSRSVVAQGNH
jgi:hypothetical protein